ncbi:hypothetical protein BT67DRAFT_7447 [Trichocladium antarcticum]|uniref:Uncharacterized protein n=1 Tax=Trichocladium antarcticum TaxID=1450529 RepID=A0AAN6USE5_9PEZI|nr:hypothetical protein BT67DRAFT_7447 [Trichocladium antarcticum]
MMPPPHPPLPHQKPHPPPKIRSALPSRTSLLGSSPSIHPSTHPLLPQPANICALAGNVDIPTNNPDRKETYGIGIKQKEKAVWVPGALVEIAEAPQDGSGKASSARKKHEADDAKTARKRDAETKRAEIEREIQSPAPPRPAPPRPLCSGKCSASTEMAAVRIVMQRASWLDG